VGTFEVAEFGPRATNLVVLRVNRQEEKLSVSCSLNPYGIGRSREELLGENYITRSQNIRKEETSSKFQSENSKERNRIGELQLGI
jgi:hypothetical protein